MMFLRGGRLELSDNKPEKGDYIYTAVTQENGRQKLIAEVKIGDAVLSDSRYATGDNISFKKECEQLFGLMLYNQLSQLTGIYPKWGTLTGIRPVKLFHSMLGKGCTAEQTADYYSKKYLVSDEKIKLALETQKRESKILAQSTPDSFSLYVSIPFCPTRCNYCSFVSHSIDRAAALLPEYVRLLCEELAVTAQTVKKIGLKLRTIYFGGGTPTTLSPEQLKQVIDVIAANFDLTYLDEYTVEAGRPDTITAEKLKALKQGGITRLSINPQTFNDAVLEHIGRRHTSKQTVDAYFLAQEIGFDNINMDIIAGLPSDTLQSFKVTVDKIMSLAPANVTVHTLSVKRSAQLADSKNEVLGDSTKTAEAMLEYAYKRFDENGYYPYYLYRQKNMLGNLENTGFCKDGYDCKYNVYIMDETHTILAVGAGAVTKLVEPNGTLIERVFNYKFPYEYIDRFEKALNDKEKVKEFYERHHF